MNNREPLTTVSGSMCGSSCLCSSVAAEQSKYLPHLGLRYIMDAGHKVWNMMGPPALPNFRIQLQILAKGKFCLFCWRLKRNCFIKPGGSGKQHIVEYEYLVTLAVSKNYGANSTFFIMTFFPERFSVSLRLLVKLSFKEK